LTSNSVKIEGDIAYIRVNQTEHFADAKGSKSSFSFSAMNAMKKHQGRWTFFASAFSEKTRQ